MMSTAGGTGAEVAERVRSLLADISFRDWAFRVEPQGDGALMWCEFTAPDTLTGRPQVQEGRRWWIPADAPDSRIVLSAFGAVVAALEHEAREDFLYKGRRIVGPHIDVDALWAVARKVDIDP